MGQDVSAAGVEESCYRRHSFPFSPGVTTDPSTCRTAEERRSGTRVRKVTDNTS